MESFNDKVVFITGTSSGIGEGLTRELVRQNARVVMVDLNKNAVDAIAHEIDPAGNRTLALRADVSVESEVQAAVQCAVERFGCIDVTVANAGVSSVDAIESITTEEYQRVFGVNFFGVVNTIRATAPELARSRGRVAIVGSCTSFLLAPYSGSYAISKSAIRGLISGIRSELAPGVTVTHLVPGFIATGIRGPNDPIPRKRLMPVTAAARAIAIGIAKRQGVCAFPAFAKLVVATDSYAPWLLPTLISLRRGKFKRPHRVDGPRTVLVSGATSRTGGLLADYYHKRGDSLILFGRDKDSLHRWEKEDRVLTAAGEPLDRPAIEEVLSRGREHFGPIDTAFTISENDTLSSVLEAESKEVRDVVNDNVLGTIGTIQAVLPYLRESRGGFGIIGGSVSRKDDALKCAINFGLRSVTRHLHHELEMNGLTVTHVGMREERINTEPMDAIKRIVAAVDGGRLSVDV